MSRNPLINLYTAQQTYGGVGITTFPRPRYVSEGYCEWCGKEITNKRRTSCCSKECSLKFNIATSPVYYANQGSRGGYGNHILRRDNYTCQVCGELHAPANEYGTHLPTTDGGLEIHHIEYVCNGGDDSPNNLTTLCKDCHKTIHKNG